MLIKKKTKPVKKVILILLFPLFLVSQETIIIGCQDSEAFNYNSAANTNCNNCCYYNPGCTDPTAINFLTEYDYDDGSCIPSVYGCMDDGYQEWSLFPGYAACDYNIEANVEGGSCNYTCLGCTDVFACNYNPDVTIDNNSCQYPSESKQTIISCDESVLW